MATFVIQCKSVMNDGDFRVVLFEFFQKDLKKHIVCEKIIDNSMILMGCAIW